MKNVSGQEYQTPRQAADELDISPQTLRAYSGLVEKTTGHTDYFHRDQNNGRLYSTQNIKDLAQVNQIKKEHSKTLKDAISEVFEQQIINSDDAAETSAASLPATSATSAAPQVAGEDSLAPILYTLKQLTDQNAQVVTQIHQLKEQLDQTNNNYEHLLKAIEVHNTAASNQAVAATSSAAIAPSAASATSTASQANKSSSASSLSMASSSAITAPKKSFWARLFSHD
ncbi:helix-turn-helix domain-containing protein [Loigolactobacillus jiayinensis]|uniref:HTH merR-type domain-containing protein n=1 Tax=Loigolactobacillus jiayinensis TaxID=2486016 RepID=A0ABW1RA85_9LACO|nr:hypothetical protein [Loigolactobacillus jiayinensis]